MEIFKKNYFVKISKKCKIIIIYDKYAKPIDKLDVTMYNLFIIKSGRENRLYDSTATY